LRIAPSESGASLSRNSWSEIPVAGHHGFEPRDPLAQLVNDFLLIHGMLRRALARPGIYLSQIRGNEKEKAVTLKTRFNDTT
jgi:hypothetical protein